VDRPLRILAVINLPWDPRLGAARVWFELAAQWTKAGHKVDHYCVTDAFLDTTQSRALSAWRQAVFPYCAARFVRRNADKFDVIDCLIGTLPFSKRSLRFRGLLVGRSIGLYSAYDQFMRYTRKRWPDQPRGKLVGRILYTFTTWLLHRNARRALRYCDLFNVPNDSEKQSLERSAPAAPKIVLPYGLNEVEGTAFANAARPATERLARKEICFLGMWSLRKGSRDWAEIVRTILNSIPDARFAFLGTMTEEATVLHDLQLTGRESIQCLTSYDPRELPQLIGNCVVGLFPSYIEGFGLSVIEQLAAGIPTFAYDVPGPRHIFKKAEFLVPMGDAKTMAQRAVEIVRMKEVDYTALSAKCREIAARFRWEQIAPETIRVYRRALGSGNSKAGA
jgi:glycosyltransferase involved in cell wall biosynthesis